MGRLPDQYKILPASIPFRVPGFYGEYRHGIETLAPAGVDCESWYFRFRDRVLSSVGKTFLPVCRMSDGEFEFLLGPQPLGPVWPWQTRLRGFIARLAAGKYFRPGGSVSQSERLRYSSGSYSREEIAAARTEYGRNLVRLLDTGVVGIHLTHGAPEPFQQHFFPAFGRWLSDNRVVLNAGNYVPFYFVYALLCGPDRLQLLTGRRVVVVHGATGEKRERITQALYRLQVAAVHWIGISSERSLFDKIDAGAGGSNADLCLVGAGVGKVGLLLQLQILSIPCIDIGYVFEVLAWGSRASPRPFTCPDSDVLSVAR